MTLYLVVFSDGYTFSDVVHGVYDAEDVAEMIATELNLKEHEPAGYSVIECELNKSIWDDN